VYFNGPLLYSCDSAQDSISIIGHYELVGARVVAS
jgi:hypothetical protein